METKTSREFLFRWLLALGCFATLIFFFSPSWAAFSLWSRVPELGGMLEVRRGVVVLEQVAHPGIEIPDPLHRVIQWRLLFPWIGHILGLPPLVFFGLAHVGCLAVLGYVVTLLRQQGLGWRDTALGSIAIGAASWFFVSTGWLGYFDSWLALGLLLVAFAKRSWVVWLACLLTPWVDERFVIAAPLALACRWLQPAPSVTTSSMRATWKRELGIPALLLAIFLVVRLALLSNRSAANATLTGYLADRDYLSAPFFYIALGTWEGLRAGWLFVLAGILLLRRSAGGAALLGIGVVLVAAIGLATAQDYGRSMTMVLPVAVLGLLHLVHENPAWRSRLLVVTTGLALLLPAHHVMNDRINPIFYLYRELAAMDTPPRIAMPEVHELEAIHAMEQRDFPKAEAELTLAIKLAHNPASAAKQRGVMYASVRRWADAKRDFTLVVESEPENIDGWFLRAQVELAAGENDAARADFEHAKSIAPSNWINRPDVSRVNALFNQPARSR